jgi:hypothetical protein
MTLSISIDVEPDLHKKSYESVKKLLAFSKLLGKYKIKATFFATCDCISKFPKVFNELKNQGHEIALHGYNHTRFDELSMKEKQDYIKKSLQCFKKYLRLKPKGFRAVQHSIDNEGLKVLEENDFLYDSSLIPWNFHHILMPQIKIKYSNNFKSMRIRKMSRFNLYEAPITSFILPFSAFTIRLLPFWMFKLYLRFIRVNKNKIFFMHSWDLLEMPDSKLYKRCPLKEFNKRLEYLFKYFSSKNQKFKPIALLPPIKA